MYRVEEAIEDLYRSTQYRPDFLADVRSLIADTVGNQDEAQRALKRQLDSQLAALEGQEENLLDLAAGGSVATDKIRLRLNKITQERERLVHQRDAVALDLTAGATYLEAQLSLLEEPFDLYRDASDEVRRRLNQAIFGAIYIVPGGVEHATFVAPHDSLHATQAAYTAVKAGYSQAKVEALFLSAFKEASSDAKKEKPGMDIVFQMPAKEVVELVTTVSKRNGSSSDCLAGIPGLEPRMTVPETVVLPITPYPKGVIPKLREDSAPRD